MQQSPTPDTSTQQETIFNEEDFLNSGYDKHIRNARIILFVIAGFQVLSIFFTGSIPEPSNWMVICITAAIAGIFIGLGLWTQKKPYTALLTALIFYLGLLALNGYFDPATIFQGFIIKAIAIVLLILGLRNAKEVQDWKKTFGK